MQVEQEKKVKAKERWLEGKVCWEQELTGEGAMRHSARSWAFYVWAKRPLLMWSRMRTLAVALQYFSASIITHSSRWDENNISHWSIFSCFILLCSRTFCTYNIMMYALVAFVPLRVVIVSDANAKNANAQWYLFPSQRLAMFVMLKMKRMDAMIYTVVVDLRVVWRAIRAILLLYLCPRLVFCGCRDVGGRSLCSR